MDTIKLTALTLAAIIAGLLSIPATEYGHRDDIGVDEPVQNPARSKAAQIIAKNNELRIDSDPITSAGEKTLEMEHFPRPIASRTPPAPAGRAANDELENWALILYPELARIVELENQPASIAVASLVPMLSDADPVVRLAALEALGDMGREAPLPALTAALDDPSPQIRIAALEALMLRRDAAAVGSIGATVFDRDTRVRIAAIDALAAIEDQASVQVLGALLSDQNTAVRHSAVGALGDVGGDLAHRYLEQSRYDPDDSIRASVDAILAEEGKDGAF